MPHPHHHSLSSVKRWGGVPDDYAAIHDFFDQSKSIIADFRHRALRHHAEGIFLAETIFGRTITLSTGRVVPTRLIGEQHVQEDLGFIPSFADWVKAIRPEPGWAAPACGIRNRRPRKKPGRTTAFCPVARLRPYITNIVRGGEHADLLRSLDHRH